MNDIQILKELLSPDAQVVLQPRQGRPSVELTDSQSGTTVKIKGLPHDSVVIKADLFKGPFPVFDEDLEDIRKRADFVIVSIDERGKKWVIYIETKGGNKSKKRIVAQLKGAKCFISYCKCIGKSFWQSTGFLDGYCYRFASIDRLNLKKRGTKPSQHKQALHNQPENFKKFSRISEIYFDRLIHPGS